nr:hypothetical protein [Tanacetum cinerariifolium]
PNLKLFWDHTEETRSSNTTTHTDDSLPEYDSFCFEIGPDQERLINVVKNDISDDSTNDPLLEEADLFLSSKNLIPPETRSSNTTTHTDDSLPEYDSFCFEIGPDQERLINVVKNDISDDSTNDPLLEEADLFLSSKNLIPPEPPDVEFDFELDKGEEISDVMNNNNELECLNPRDEFVCYLFQDFSFFSLR